MLQFTRTTVPGLMDMEYRYTAGQNNGRITQSKDWISGEEIAYTYDSLQRLASATTTGPEWGEAYSYDGFGNLTGKAATKGQPPSVYIAINPANNQPVNGNYDANGNVVKYQSTDPPMVWDAENRMVQQVINGVTQTYVYDPWGRRIVGPGGYTFYGAAGDRWGPDGKYLTWAGAPLRVDGQPEARDRLGSVRAIGDGSNPAWRMQYRPYGEEQQPTADARVKFATYTRDSTTLAQDYADQRYYSNGLGSFYSPDPGGAATARTPLSWNRYSYSYGDPVNLRDVSGLLAAAPQENCGPDWLWDASLEGPCEDDSGGNPCNSGGMGFLGFDPSCGGGGAPAPLPEPEPAWKCPDKYQNWINSHGTDAASVAAQIGTTEADVLGLSALESGWGDGPFATVGRNNYFNLESRKLKLGGNPPLLPYSTGWASARGDSSVLVATYGSYLASAKSFAAVDGSLINGVTDPTRFATILQQRGKFGQGPNGPVESFVGDVVSIVRLLNRCLGN